MTATMLLETDVMVPAGEAGKQGSMERLDPFHGGHEVPLAMDEQDASSGCEGGKVPVVIGTLLGPRHARCVGR